MSTIDTKQLETEVIEAIKTCYDPEIPVNIVDLGLIYECKVQEVAPEQHRVSVEMTLTAPGCPVAGEMPGHVAAALAGVEGVGLATVRLVRACPAFDAGAVAAVLAPAPTVPAAQWPWLRRLLARLD